MEQPSLRLMSFHNRIWFEGPKLAQVLGSPKKKRKFKYKIGQSNVTRHTRGTNGDLSAWAPL